jgi:hypothetical protein
MSKPMPDQKWYQKASAQAALVTGAFTIIAGVVTVLLKDRSSPDAPKVTGPSSATAQRSAVNGPKYDGDYSPESADARRALRGSLRNLSAAESGLKVGNVPPGTFGFAHPTLFRYDKFEVDRVPNGRLSFEVHKVAADEIYAIVFVNADNQRKIQLESKVTEPMTIYSDMWNDARYPVRVNVASCVGESRLVTLDDSKRIIAVDCLGTTSK